MAHYLPPSRKTVKVEGKTGTPRTRGYRHSHRTYASHRISGIPLGDSAEGATALVEGDRRHATRFGRAARHAVGGSDRRLTYRCFARSISPSGSVNRLNGIVLVGLGR